MEVNEKETVYDYLRKYFEEEIAFELCYSGEKSIVSILLDINNYCNENQMFKVEDEFYKLKRVFLNLGLNEFALEAEQLYYYSQSRNFIKFFELNKFFIQKVNLLLENNISKHII